MMDAQNFETARTETIGDDIWSSVYSKRAEAAIPDWGTRMREVQKQVGAVSNDGQRFQRNLGSRFAFEIGINPI
jgi:hypothetical protein